MAEQVTASLGDEEAELRSAELTECSRTVPHACRDSIATMEEEGIEQTHNNTKRESPDMEDLDSFNLIEPPPLDWRSDSSSEAPCSVEEMDEPGTFHAEVLDAPADLPSDITTQDTNSSSAQTLSCQGRSSDQPGHDVHKPQDEKHVQEEEEVAEVILEKTLEEIRRGEEVAHDVPVEGRRNMELLDTSEEGWRREQEVQETHEEYWRREEEVEETLEEGWRREGEVQETLEEGWRSKQEVQETLEEGWRSKQEVPETVDERRKVKESWRDNDTDHSHIQTLLTQLQLVQPTPPEEASIAPPSASFIPDPNHSPCPTEWSGGANGTSEESSASGLLFTERHQRDVQDLLEDYDPEQAGSELSVPQAGLTRPSLRQTAGSLHPDQNLPVSIGQQEQQPVWHRRPLQGSTNWQAPGDEFVMSGYPDEELLEAWQQSVAAAEGEESSASKPEEGADDRPAYKDVPGPCDPEDLLEGVIFGAKYLGSTQMQSEKNPSTNARMTQAQEAVDRIKAPEGESQPQTEVDLFISTQRIKVLSADTQEAMMDHALQMISYIADIGNVVVLMARRKPSSRKTPESTGSSSTTKKKCWMICHVFSSEDASVIAQAIGQAFGVAYQQFLQANGIKSSQLPPGEYSDYLGTQELYNGDLVHFSCSENIREVCIDKQAGEALGVAVVESGWGSILPTVVVANLLHGGPAERCGELSIGDRVMSVNGTSLVGLPIATCQNIIRELKPQTQVKLSIVHCPPVTMAIIRRPDPKYQLGFSVEDGIICSLMRGGIAERGGIRVGHRIIEINGQSVVATPHEKIIHILTQAVGEIHLKTMPASTYRLLTGQEQPVFL